MRHEATQTFCAACYDNLTLQVAGENDQLEAHQGTCKYAYGETQVIVVLELAKCYRVIRALCPVLEPNSVVVTVKFDTMPAVSACMSACTSQNM